jgi:hypothetical protein
MMFGYAQQHLMSIRDPDGVAIDKQHRRGTSAYKGDNLPLLIAAGPGAEMKGRAEAARTGFYCPAMHLAIAS